MASTTVSIVSTKVSIDARGVSSRSGDVLLAAGGRFSVPRAGRAPLPCFFLKKVFFGKLFFSLFQKKESFFFLMGVVSALNIVVSTSSLPLVGRQGRQGRPTRGQGSAQGTALARPAARALWPRRQGGAELSKLEPYFFFSLK